MEYKGEFIKKIRIWFLATRPQFFPAIIIPITLGSTLAWQRDGLFSTFLFAFCLIAGILYHGGINVLNDYFDHIRGTDDINVNPLTPYAGGSRMIQLGILTPRETAIFGIILLVLGSIIGLYLACMRGWWLIPLGTVGLFSGVFYSAPPFSLYSRGIGEALVGLNFGILSVLGAYYVQTGTAVAEVFIISLPISFLIAAILYINEFPDHDSDKETGKLTLVVRLGKKKARHGFLILILSSLMSVLLGVYFGYLHFISLISVVPICLGLLAAKRLYCHFDNKNELLPAIKTTILVYTWTGVLLILTSIIDNLSWVSS